jgi:hypothetical protein
LIEQVIDTKKIGTSIKIMTIASKNLRSNGPSPTREEIYILYLVFSADKNSLFQATLKNGPSRPKDAIEVYSLTSSGHARGTKPNP